MVPELLFLNCGFSLAAKARRPLCNVAVKQASTMARACLTSRRVARSRVHCELGCPNGHGGVASDTLAYSILRLYGIALSDKVDESHLLGFIRGHKTCRE